MPVLIALVAQEVLLGLEVHPVMAGQADKLLQTLSYLAYLMLWSRLTRWEGRGAAVAVAAQMLKPLE
jgi:hypothetical protein